SEQATAKSCFTNHSTTQKIKDAYRINRRDPFNWESRLPAIMLNDSAWESRIKRIPNNDRYLFKKGWNHRRRVNYFRPKIRKLHCFRVRQNRQWKCLFNYSWICSKHPFNIRPYLYSLRV